MCLVSLGAVLIECPLLLPLNALVHQTLLAQQLLLSLTLSPKPRTAIPTFLSSSPRSEIPRRVHPTAPQQLQRRSTNPLSSCTSSLSHNSSRFCSFIITLTSPPNHGQLAHNPHRHPPSQYRFQKPSLHPRLHRRLPSRQNNPKSLLLINAWSHSCFTT